MSPADRIELLIKHSKLNRRHLGIRLGYKDGTALYHIIKGRNNISANLANKICDAFPDVNYNWLMGGEGEMLLNKEETPKNDLLERIEFLEDHIKGINARLKILEQNQDAKLTTPNKELA